MKNSVCSSFSSAPHPIIPQQKNSTQNNLTKKTDATSCVACPIEKYFHPNKSRKNPSQKNLEILFEKKVGIKKKGSFEMIPKKCTHFYLKIIQKENLLDWK